MANNSINFRQFTSKNSDSQCVSGFILVRMAIPKSLPGRFAFCTSIITSLTSPAFFREVITLNRFFAFISFFVFAFSFLTADFNCRLLGIYSCAYYAITLVTIFTRTIFVKFSSWFDLLAFRTIFCLNRIRHGLFLYKRFVFRAGYSTYCNRLALLWNLK